MATRNYRAPLALLAVASIVFFLNLDGASLWDDDEPKNASCGREMLESGNWIVPIFNAELRSHKPVMLYWAMIASYSAVGVSEFGARLPSVLAGLGTVLLCFQLGRLLYDRTTGLAAGLLLACGLMFAVLSRAATPDAILILWVTSAAYFFVRGMATLRGGSFSAQDVSLEQTPLPIKSALAMYAAMGLAVLTKGPIGVLLPVTVIACYGIVLSTPITVTNASENISRWRRMWLWCRDRFAPSRLWRFARGIRFTLGVGVVTAVALPWYVAVTLATDGAWLTGFLGTHNVHRFLAPMEGHSGPPVYYVIAILAGFFPGSCFLPVAVVQAIGEQRRRSPLANSHAFLLSWIGVFLVFFSLAATKLPNYIVPCYPALALLTGWWIIRAVRSAAESRFWLRIGLASYAGVGLLLTVGLAITASIYLDGDGLVAVTGLVPLVGGIVAVVLLRRESARPAIAAFAISGALFTVCATSVTAPRVSPYQTSPLVAEQFNQIRNLLGDDATEFGTYHYTKPNIVFYVGKPVPTLGSDEQAAEFFVEHPGGYLAMPAADYQRLASQLPAGVAIVHTEPKFMKPAEEVVVVGRPAQLARRPATNSNLQ